MKAILIFITLFITTLATGALAQTAVYETVCEKQDCFKEGWTTTSANGFKLKAECNLHECATKGWTAKANDKTFYEVKCEEKACFSVGWTSLEDQHGFRHYDTVACKNEDCLKSGWTVRTGFDFFGGNVTCTENDCAKFGDTSTWLGRPSKTVCHDGDCYKNGWTLTVY
jgi:hypothetical protein